MKTIKPKNEENDPEDDFLPKKNRVRNFNSVSTTIRCSDIV